MWVATERFQPSASTKAPTLTPDFDPGFTCRRRTGEKQWMSDQARHVGKRRSAHAFTADLIWAHLLRGVGKWQAIEPKVSGYTCRPPRMGFIWSTPKQGAPMALITCEDCSREISDRALACPNCGAPVAEATVGPDRISLDGENFVGSKRLLTRLAVKAIQSLNYKVDSADEASGLVSFTTGMTWGSWSGVSGSIFFEEVRQHTFRASGSGKQNVRGGQLIALNLFDEANSKVRNVLDEMRRLTPGH
jgi:hypothetical protein